MKNMSKILRFKKPLIMGILNVTPDSFSDGGKWLSKKHAFNHALDMIRDGADIVDIGGESTGPGSKDVDEKEEWSRIESVVSELLSYRQKTPKQFFLISIDTYKPAVAERALQLGVDMINDVTALRYGQENMAELIRKYKIPIILMYSKDSSPRTTRKKRRYTNVVQTIKGFLQERITFALEQGIQKEQIIVDPGMGAFVSGIGKYSFEIIKRLQELAEFGYPICIGTSRKGFLGKALGDLQPVERGEATIVSSLIAVQNGARIVRVHDVRAMKRAVQVYKSASIEKLKTQN